MLEDIVIPENYNLRNVNREEWTVAAIMTGDSYEKIASFVHSHHAFEFSKSIICFKTQVIAPSIKVVQHDPPIEDASGVLVASTRERI